MLVVDDEQGVRDYFKRLFVGPEYEVHGACGGREALEKLAAYGFDMMILDLVMPGMDGMEVLRKVRETQKDLLVFVITGYPSEETTRESLECGCVDYVHKPFDPEEIKNLVNDVFELKRYRFRGMHVPEMESPFHPSDRLPSTPLGTGRADPLEE
jgi:DNA-binding response OmpR family regulator